MSTAWPWPAPADDGGAAHLAVGTALPDVALASTAGGNVSLAGLPRAVVFCYTWTGGPGLTNPPDWDVIPGAHGSTPQAEGFRDHYPAFQQAGWQVLGVSTQGTAHQREFAARLKLPFALLSDQDLRLQSALRLPTFSTGGVTYLKRLTMVVRDGRIARVIYPVHPPDTHAREMVDVLTRG